MLLLCRSCPLAPFAPPQQELSAYYVRPLSSSVALRVLVRACLPPRMASASPASQPASCSLQPRPRNPTCTNPHHIPNTFATQQAE